MSNQSNFTDETRRQELLKSREERFINRGVSSGTRIKALERSTAETLDKLRQSGSRARSNTGGAAFNIITMKYLETPEGLRLKRHDDLIIYRSRLRALNLAAKNHLGFNPITGGTTFELGMPEPEKLLFKGYGVYSTNTSYISRLLRVGVWLCWAGPKLKKPCVIYDASI